MNGLLIYNKDDYHRNESYVDWLLQAGKEYDLNLKLVFKEDFLRKGISHKDKIDFVINRSRSYEISLMFELTNIRVFNNSTITLLGNNKLAAYRYAKDKGYAYPRVLVAWENKNNIISKPNDGHGGQGIDLVENVDFNDGSIRLQQEFLGSLVGDIRFYIIDNKIIHGVLRTSRDKIISNFTQGGDIKYYDYTAEEKAYVEGFIKDLKVDYAGIDFLLTKDNKLIFNEIEDVVGSRMLSKLGINNTTDLYLEHIGKELKNC
ncbi:MAG: ATP-grasp domain-containing protein [Tissierellia bacterium]|nr:ATP-grasp domain-containing protein [Tissierellia bacterium]